MEIKIQEIKLEESRKVKELIKKNSAVEKRNVELESENAKLINDKDQASKEIMKNEKK